MDIYTLLLLYHKFHTLTWPVSAWSLLENLSKALLSPLYHPSFLSLGNTFPLLHTLHPSFPLLLCSDQQASPYFISKLYFFSSFTCSQSITSSFTFTYSSFTSGSSLSLLLPPNYYPYPYALPPMCPFLFLYLRLILCLLLYPPAIQHSSISDQSITSCFTTVRFTYIPSAFCPLPSSLASIFSIFLSPYPPLHCWLPLPPLCH